MPFFDRREVRERGGVESAYGVGECRGGDRNAVACIRCPSALRTGPAGRYELLVGCKVRAFTAGKTLTHCYLTRVRTCLGDDVGDRSLQRPTVAPLSAGQYSEHACRVIHAGAMHPADHGIGTPLRLSEDVRHIYAEYAQSEHSKAAEAP